MVGRHRNVALFVSAWIEMIDVYTYGDSKLVALFVSAWIEIVVVEPSLIATSSRTLCECVD